MASVYTVSQVNNYIKNMFSEDFLLKNVYIKGEVSNCKYHSSGHIYFSLKDKGGVISAIMFAGNRSGLKFKMEEGQNVIVLGSIAVYERDGKYQIYAREIILEGAGLLYQRFEQLKAELEEKGLFSDIYKKPIPRYATKIGICTAQTGAAIQDMIRTARERNPYVQLYLYPCFVQGEMAAPDIVNGIRCLDQMNLDVIIVGRGGGSIEDLWAFNEEIVAQAIFDCNTPIISAVGHETDTTISDFVADKRVPTPTAAAELAVFDYNEFMDKLNNCTKLLTAYMKHSVEGYKAKNKYYESVIQRFSPNNQLLVKKQYVADLSTKLLDTFNNTLINRRHKLIVLAERLGGLSPLNKISKGFAYVSNEKGKAVKSVEDIKVDDTLSLIISDGKIDTKVTNIQGGVFDGK